MTEGKSWHQLYKRGSATRFLLNLLASQAASDVSRSL